MKFSNGLIALVCAAGLGGCNNEPTSLAENQAAPAPVKAVTKDPLLSAVGIGVSDLERSTDFYVNVMGMEKVRTYELSYMNEVLLRYPDNESYIVLMHWIDGSNPSYTNLPVKIVTRVKDPAALAARIKAAGFGVTREPTPSEQVEGSVVGFAKDPDGYVLELLPLRQATASASN